MTRSRSADMAAFKRASEERRMMIADPATGDIYCELPGCGRWLDPATVPHHLSGYAAGQGGRRKHDPEGLRFLCRQHHDAIEMHRISEDELR